MKKVLNRVVSQVIAMMISVQMIGQYGASFLPLVNAVGNEVHVEDGQKETEPITDVSEDNASEEITDIAEDNLAMSEVEELAEETLYEDWNITSNTTLNETKEVNNLTISNGTLNLNGNSLIVHGDVTLNYNGNLKCGTGFLSCNNFIMNSGSYLYMTNTNNRIIVNGNFMHSGGSVNSSNATAGTIEIKGDFTSKNSGFNPTAEHIVILNGTEKQTISLNGVSSNFNILEIDNTSREGVFSETAVPANVSCIKGESKISFAGGDKTGETLTADKKFGGDYCLAAGKLDLNGRKLTINGNLIQTGGEVVLNGGTLEVTGDYRIQSRTENEDGTYKYGYSTDS